MSLLAVLSQQGDSIAAHNADAAAHTSRMLLKQDQTTYYDILPRVLADSTTANTLTLGTLPNMGIGLSVFSPDRDLLVRGIAMASGATPGSGQTLSRFALYEFAESSRYSAPTNVETIRGSVHLLARTANDTTVFTVANTVYPRNFDGSDGYAVSVPLKKGHRYAVGALVAGGVAPQVIGKALRRTQLAALNPPQSIVPGGIPATDTVLHFATGSINAGFTDSVWVALLIDPRTYGPSQATVVLLGDSITASYAGWWSVANSKSGLKYRVLNNAGISGQRIEQISARITDDAQAYGPSSVVFLAGTNDLVQNRTAGQMIADYEAAFAAMAWASEIIFPIVPPLLSPTAGQTAALSAVRAWALSYSNPKVKVIDAGIAMSTGDGLTANAGLYIDGVHPNEAGQLAFGTALAAGM